MALMGMWLNGVEGVFVPLDLIERTQEAMREVRVNTDAYLHELGEQDERLDVLRDTQRHLESRIANQRRELAAKENALAYAKQDAAVANKALKGLIDAMTDQEWQAIAGRMFFPLRTIEQEAEQARAAEKVALAERVLGSFGDEDDEADACHCDDCRSGHMASRIDLAFERSWF